MDTLVDSELFFLRFRQCKVHTVYSDDNVDIIYSGSYDRQKSQERKGYACRRQRNSDKRRKEKAKRYGKEEKKTSFNRTSGGKLRSIDIFEVL